MLKKFDKWSVKFMMKQVVNIETGVENCIDIAKNVVKINNPTNVQIVFNAPSCERTSSEHTSVTVSADEDEAITLTKILAVAVVVCIGIAVLPYAISSLLSTFALAAPSSSK